MLNDGNLHMKLVLLLLVTMFYHLLAALDMSTHYIHMNVSVFGVCVCVCCFVDSAESGFLFLFHIYVKIHFVFYSYARVSLRTYSEWSCSFHSPSPSKIGIIFERYRAHYNSNSRRKKYIIERACKSMRKIQRHITAAELDTGK